MSQIEFSDILGKISAWMDGYLTAFGHLNTLKNTASSGTQIVDWVAAIGVIITAAISAYAANQARKSAAASHEVTLENLRTNVLQDANSTHHNCNDAMEEVAAVSRAAENSTFLGGRSPRIRELLDQLNSDWEAYQRHSLSAANIWRDAINAITIKEITEARRRLHILHSNIKTLDLITKNRQGIARKSGLISNSLLDKERR